jgi:hypothetical protein
VRSRQRLGKADKQLWELCSGCEKISAQLLGVLQDLRLPGSHVRWKSFRQALMSVWKENEIDTMSKRLERYRRQIDTVLLVSMREQILKEQVDKVKEQVDKDKFVEGRINEQKLREKKNPLQVESSKEKALREEHQRNEAIREYEYIQATKEDTAEPNLQTIGRTVADVKQVQKELMDILEQSKGSLRSQNEKDLFHSAISGSTRTVMENQVKSQILEKLRFTTMQARFDRIPKAYEQTLDWIFREPNDRTGVIMGGTSLRNFGQQTHVLSTSDMSQNHRPWSNFVKWLNGDEALYWITGNPGSGKSTLMKYLSLDRRTAAFLEMWGGKIPLVSAKQIKRWGLQIPAVTAEQLEKSGGTMHIISAEQLEDWRRKMGIVPTKKDLEEWEVGIPIITAEHLEKLGGMIYIVTAKHVEKWGYKIPIITARFFFWNSGTTMQMSEMGLLQTLLSQALTDHKELIPDLFPERWRYYQLFANDLHPWSLSELYQAFKSLISNDSKRFFFFIDGMDEFDGDEGKIARFILNIASSRQNIKLCVSSRPWLAFEDAFRNRPSLRLEHLTAPDIKHFVSGNLNNNRMFSQLQKIRPVDANGLILEVTEKACGVFLWVHLVVLSLLEGLRDGDDIMDLRERLLLLPSDLEQLFGKILGRLSPRYLKEAKMIFQLIRTATEPLSLLSLSFARETIEKATTAEVKVMDPDEMLFRAESMRRRLNSRCKGLIEAPDFEEDGPNAKAQYLHRTVKDFLSKTRAWEDLALSEQDRFDPDMALCAAFLLHLKAMNQNKTVFLEEFWDAFRTCIHYSSRFKDREPHFHADVFRSLDQTGDALFECAHSNGESWLKILVADGRAQGLFSMERINHWYQTGLTQDTTMGDFFDCALKYKLPSYLKFKLQADERFDFGDTGPHLLSNAVLRQDVQTVRLLLQRGVSPNCEVGNRTAWHSVLDAATSLSADDVKKKWASIVQSFLEHGADFRIIVKDNSVEASIRVAFQDWDPTRTEELLGRLERSAKSPKRQKRIKWSSTNLKVLFKRSNKSGAASSNHNTIAS